MLCLGGGFVVAVELVEEVFDLFADFGLGPKVKVVHLLKADELSLIEVVDCITPDIVAIAIASGAIIGQ